MKIEMFFEKFDQLASAPNAIPKLRAIIIQSAVSGLLSGNRVQEWKLTRVGDVAEIQNGFAFKSDFFNEVREGMPLIRIRDLARGETQVFYSGEFREEFVVRKGDLLIGMDGNFEIHRWGGSDALLNQRVCRVQNLLQDIAPEFLFLSIQEHLEEIHRKTTFTTVKHISAAQIREISILLPSRVEQERIAAKVAELMALCDRLEVEQEERETRQAEIGRASLSRFTDAPTPANLHFLFHRSYDIVPTDLRKSILALAVQGKLVEHDPKEESVDGLLVEMQERQHLLIEARKIRKPRHLPPVGEDELLFSIPRSWRWARWGQICDWITYGFTRPMSHVEEGPRIITAKNVQDGRMTFENTHHADVREFANLNPKDLPRKGDILITKDGTIGRAALVETTVPFCINQSVAVLWLESCLLYRPFMLMVIRSPFGQEPILRAAEGMAIKHLSITDFGWMTLPIPPLAEQRRIVAKVEELMALVDKLEGQLSASRELGADLLEAVVAELMA